MSATALHISGLRVTLGGNDILVGVDAEIQQGEFVGIFGPNGAGKTTLVRAILGAIHPSAGEIRLPGSTPREIGYMPQGHGALEGSALSARAVLEAVCGGERWGVPWPSRETCAEIDRVLDLTQARSYADRPFSVLSGGERQRIMLAQALLGRPKILILDEPLASLDPRHQALLIECVAGVRRETGATVLFVAHDMNPLLSVMDRVLYMAGGGAVLGRVDEVVTTETLTRLYHFPIEVVRAGGRIFVVSQEGSVNETCGHHHHDE
jgi:zinc/manganese transport system ATP-binding protein